MEFLNSGSSLYHEICAFYLRDSEWRLLNVRGPYSKAVEETWPSLRDSTYHPSCRKGRLNLGQSGHTSVVQLDPEIASNIRLAKSLGLGELPAGAAIRIQEIAKEEGCSYGVISVVPEKYEDGLNLRTWTLSLVLLRSHTSVRHQVPENVDALADRYATQITDLFDKKLRNTPVNDQWAVTGRYRFRASVLKFTSCSQKIEFCLPAFPCKSTNPQKTAGRDPDLAEQVALETLHDFVHEVRKLYPAGAKVWIVSDGHVFSDCSMFSNAS